VTTSTGSATRAARTAATFVVAVASGASVGVALIEAALVVDFALAECPTSPGAKPNGSYLLVFLVLCLVPLGAVVGGLLWRRLALVAWLGVGLAAWAATLGLYRVLEGVLNGGFLSPC
jgi:hypothetical protein